MVKIPKIVNESDGKYVCWGRTEFVQFAKDTDDTIFKLINTDFDVKINGETCEVRECRVSKIPFNRPWPGKQRQFEQSESAGFISFSSDENVEIKVKRKKPFDNAIIRPLSKNIVVGIVDDEVVFTLTEHGQYVLEFGDTHNVLHIFFNKIKEYPKAKDATFYFGPGMHFPGVISLRDNDTVYIDEEAVVFGSLYSAKAKNVRIFGGGVLDNSCEERITEHCYEDHTKGTFRIYNCENIEVSDIILTNSSTWALSMFDSKNVHIDNVKIVGHWRYNTDGIDVVNSEKVLIENCFIRSFDDTISIKAIYNHSKPVQDIKVDNCVMWCGWGKNCEVGLETDAEEYKNIVFRNCDLIHNSMGAMCISNGHRADIHNILFENINVEFQKETLYEVIQREDSQKYDDGGKKMPPYVIRNRVEEYPIRIICPTKLKRKASEKIGNIHDVVYKNINIYTDDKSVKPIILMESHFSERIIKNFKLENFYINGVKAENFDDFEVMLNNVENITIL